MSKGVPRLDGDQQIGSRKSYFTDLTDEQWVLVERLKVIFGDNKYRNHSFNAWQKSNRPQWTIEELMLRRLAPSDPPQTFNYRNPPKLIHSAA